MKHGDAADVKVVLAGNPNVGKSTVFNALTGMKQHTGNWTGKTVDTARGRLTTKKRTYVIEDVPGTYSLDAHSPEEESARDAVCFGNADITVIVCDASAPERSMNLILQICEVTDSVIVCFNLIDEARKRHVEVDTDRLSEILNVPVVAVSARKKKGLAPLTDALDSYRSKGKSLKVTYSPHTEKAISTVCEAVGSIFPDDENVRRISLSLICGNENTVNAIRNRYKFDFMHNGEIMNAVAEAKAFLTSQGITDEKFRDGIADTVNAVGRKIASVCVEYGSVPDEKDRKADRVLTGKYTAYPLMLLLLALIFLITVKLSNYPSQWLSSLFEKGGIVLTDALNIIKAPAWFTDMTVNGIYKVLSWVVSVMLPPMAIFFPMFTLLEDSGYLPRIAYNLDRPFAKCNACGKQALTMSMGFGCNAVGITGCRIIDSPRERLLGILTNCFVPCNGRFPALISVISAFAAASSGNSAVVPSLILTAVTVFSVAMTFLATKILSATVLKGEPSSFTIELPPYRMPQLGKTVIRSVFDRTLFVLGRAAAVAAPAGLVLWVLANTSLHGVPLLTVMSGFLDPLGELMGLDGTILLAFILGFPANETVVPTAVMIYANSTQILSDVSDASLSAVFTADGGNYITAVCFIIFMLMHFPCSTSLLTVKKETGSMKWTVIAALFPTAMGMLMCIAVNLILSAVNMII